MTEHDRVCPSVAHMSISVAVIDCPLRENAIRLPISCTGLPNSCSSRLYSGILLRNGHTPPHAVSNILALRGASQWRSFRPPFCP
jgi:hypothetical protein